MKTIQSSNLPQSLLREIMARKIFANRKNNGSDCHGLHFSVLINTRNEKRLEAYE